MVWILHEHREHGCLVNIDSPNQNNWSTLPREGECQSNHQTEHRFEETRFHRSDKPTNPSKHNQSSLPPFPFLSAWQMIIKFNYWTRTQPTNQRMVNLNDESVRRVDKSPPQPKPIRIRVIPPSGANQMKSGMKKWKNLYFLPDFIDKLVVAWRHALQ